MCIITGRQEHNYQKINGRKSYSFSLVVAHFTPKTLMPTSV